MAQHFLVRPERPDDEDAVADIHEEAFERPDEARPVASLRRGGFHSGAEIVVPGDPCSSLLIEKLRGPPSFGSRMPLDGPPFLTEEEIQRFQDWIAEGAEED